MNRRLLAEARMIPDAYAPNPGPGASFHVKYSVTRNDGRVLSVVFTGISMGYRGNHPNSFYFPISLDVATGEQIRLADHAIIDDRFVNEFVAAANAILADPPPPAFITDVYTMADLKEQLQNGDVWIKGQGVPEVLSSLTTDGVTVSIWLPYSFGSHLEVTLPDDAITIR